MTDIAFAIPGDLSARTGGYAYDRAILAGLREAGHSVAHLQLGGSFPDPTAADRNGAIAALAALAPTTIALVDGLAYAVLPPDELGTLAAPLVALVHHPLADETGLSEARRATLEAAEHAALQKARAVITTSQTTATILTARFGVPADAITVALPGLERSAFQDNQPTDPPSIVAIGTLIPRKGFDVLLSALASLHDVPYVAHIVGSDQRHDTVPAALKAYAATPPLAGRVIFHGELERAPIAALLAQATVFCLPSRNEGFGMVFAEAMAASLPVVGCRAGAVPEVVPPEAGILVDIDDPTALANALRLMLTDTTARARFAVAARRRAEALPSWAESTRVIAARLQRL